MAYLNGKRIGINAHAICDTDASYAKGYADGEACGYETGRQAGFNEGEAYGVTEGQKSMAVKATVTGETAVCEYVHPTAHEVAVQLESKNLLPYPYYHKTRTQNGITFTDNGDGTVTVNGTATGKAEFILRHIQAYPTLQRGETAYLSGCPAGGSAETYYLYDNYTGHRDTGSGTGKLTHYMDGAFASLKIVVMSGTACNNLVFKPMVTRIKTAYADRTPYITDFSDISLLAMPSVGENQIYRSNADGSVSGVKSMSPNMIIAPDDGVLVTAAYWLDAERKLKDVGVALSHFGGDL